MSPLGGACTGSWVPLAAGTVIGASVFTMLGLGARVAGANPPLDQAEPGLVHANFTGGRAKDKAE